jgi:hypothetical protein
VVSIIVLGEVVLGMHIVLLITIIISWSHVIVSYYHHGHLSCVASSCMMTILVSKSNCASQE